MGARGPQPSERPGQMIGFQCPAHIVDEIEKAVKKSGRSKSSIVAAAVEAGISAVWTVIHAQKQQGKSGALNEKRPAKRASKKR